jgi:hypothetical protein
VGWRHREEPPGGYHSEHALTLNIPLFPKLHQVIKERSGDQGPEITPHVEIGLEPTGLSLQLKAQRVILVTGDPIIHVAAKVEDLTGPFQLGPELDGNEWRIVYQNAALLNRGDEEILVPFPFQDGCE